MAPAIPEKRQLLLQAALPLFLKNGFERTKTSEISKKAGVGTGTLFNYFQGKEDIFNALFLELKERHTAIMKEAVSIDGTLEERLMNLWRSLARATMDDSEGFRFIEKFSRSSRLDPKSVESVKRKYDFLNRLYLEGREAGLCRPMDPDLAVSVWLAAFRALVGRLEASPIGEDEREELIGQGFDYLWRGLLA